MLSRDNYLIQSAKLEALGQVPGEALQRREEATALLHTKRPEGLHEGAPKAIVGMEEKEGQTMRKVMMGLTGTLVVLGVVLGPRPGEAIDSCSITGIYSLSGFALGDTEVFGSLLFTPNGPCTGGTFTGSVTIKQGGNPATTIAPTGTYVVNADTTTSITAPGLVTLTGNVSQIANNLANAIHAAGDVGGAINVGLTMTRSAVTGVSTILDRSPGVVTVSNTSAPTIVYGFTVPANTLVGGKLLRGRLLYDYTNNTGSPKNLVIELVFGSGLIAAGVGPNLSTGFALGELEFVLGDTLSSSFQNGGLRGVHSHPSAGSILLAGAGTAGENLGTPQMIGIQIVHGAASADLIFRKLSVVLELL